MINGVKARYSVGIWDDNPVASNLSVYLSLYAVDIGRPVRNPPVRGIHNPKHLLRRLRLMRLQR